MQNFSMFIGWEQCNFHVILGQNSEIPVQITKFKNFALQCFRLDLGTFFTVYKHKVISEFVQPVQPAVLCERKDWGEVKKTTCQKTELFLILCPPVDGKNWLALCIWLVNQNRVNMQAVWCSKLWHFWMNLYNVCSVSY